VTERAYSLYRNVVPEIPKVPDTIPGSAAKPDIRKIVQLNNNKKPTAVFFGINLNRYRIYVAE